MTRTKRMIVAAVVPLSLCAGCTGITGHDFTAPAQSPFTFGRTTEADVIAVDGPPASQTITTVRMHDKASPSPFDWADVGGLYSILRYSYNVTTVGSTPGLKGATFVFWNGRLASSAFTDSSAGHSTDFDAIQARSLLNAGNVTRDDVVARFGPPGGRSEYPLTGAPGDEVYQYQFIGPDKITGKRVNKWLRVLFDRDGRMISYKLSVKDVPLPVIPQVMPIFVPMPRR